MLKQNGKMPEIILSEGGNHPLEHLTQFAFVSLPPFSHVPVLLFVPPKDCNLATPLHVFITVSYPIHRFPFHLLVLFHFHLLFSILFRDHFFLAIGGLKT